MEGGSREHKEEMRQAGLGQDHLGGDLQGQPFILNLNVDQQVEPLYPLCPMCSHPVLATAREDFTLGKAVP